MLYGLWVGVTFAVPLSSLFTTEEPILRAVYIVLLIIHVVCIPLELKIQRRFLCSTAWAREQGFAPERLRLFSFRRGQRQASAQKTTRPEVDRSNSRPGCEMSRWSNY